MKISNIDIRLCRHNNSVMKDSEMRDGKKSDLEFLVITFDTDEGLSASTFGFAGRGAEMAGGIANSIFKPFFLILLGFIVMGFDERRKLFKDARFEDCGLKDTNELNKIIIKRVLLKTQSK